ncbi:hypothetical protein NGB58_25500 [Escherichia coli]|nr:hypothetical protein [Escherichia coli]
MTTKEQLELMFNEIRQVIRKHINETTDADIKLEKISNTGRVKIFIQIKNISDIEISFQPSSK